MNKACATLASLLTAVCLMSAAYADPGTPPPPPGSPPPPPGASNPPPPGPPGRMQSPQAFQKIKTHMLDKQQQRIQILQQAATCIQAATAMDQLKDCREKEHQALQQQMKPQK